MPTPKSVVKVKQNKDGAFVEYTSSVDKVEYTMKELCRAALRDVAKYVGKEFRSSFYGHFKRRTGKGPRAYYYKVYSSENTKYPRVDMGLPHTYNGKKVIGFYSFFQEVGSSKQPKLGLLTNAVRDNVDTIVSIEAQYLSALEDEARALAQINEEEYEGGEEL